MATLMPGGYAVSGIAPNPPERAVLADPISIAQGEMEFVGLYSLLGTVADVLNAPPIRHRVRLFEMASWRWIRTTASALDGAWAFHNLSYQPEGYAVMIDDTHVPPLQPLIYARLTPTLPTGAPIPLVFVNGHVISGNVTKVGGDAADLVAFRGWESKAWLANVVPDENGDWSILWLRKRTMLTG